MNRPRLGGGALAIVLAFIAGCASGDGESSAASESSMVDAIDDAAELDTILGNDRVARVLRANPGASTHTVDSFEDLFKVGRKCDRTDGKSKEVFVIEEKSTRISGEQVETDVSFPRLVVGGCNKTPEASLRGSFDLFVALVSDQSRPVDDPIQRGPIEVMTLDDTTGLYNFYVLEPGPSPESPSTVTRFVRTAGDKVEKWQKVPGEPATKAVSANRKCYDCHVHGGPIMNEIARPWTGWVSSLKDQLSRPLTGMSRTLVGEARPWKDDPDPHTRSSLADQLDDVMTAGIQAWVEGSTARPGSGLGPQVLSGAQPGGIAALARSVLCETEVNYASVAAADTIPVSLFFDEALTTLGGLQAPHARIGDSFPQLLPTRSEVDERIEKFLVKKGFLTVDVARAARLVDDEHDIFSKARCDLHAPVVTRLGQGTTLNEAIRASILEALPAPKAGKDSASVRASYIRALLDPETAAEARDAAELAYVADLSARLEAEAQKLDTAAGRAELERRLAERQAQARALFPRAANPLPITPHPATPTAANP